MSPIKDVPLLRKGLEHITDHPEEWEQCSYGHRSDCGTVGCLAYHIVVLAGHTVVMDGHGSVPSVAGFDSRGGSALVPYVAAADLGLDLPQKWKLFDSFNSLLRLWELAAEFTDGEIEVPQHVKGQS